MMNQAAGSTLRFASQFGQHFMNCGPENRKAVLFLYSLPCQEPQLAATAWVSQQTNSRAGEGPRLIRKHNFPSVYEVQPLCPNMRRDDRFGHRRRLKYLKASAAPDAKRNDAEGSFGNLRAHIRHLPHNFDSRNPN